MFLLRKHARPLSFFSHEWDSHRSWVRGFGGLPSISSSRRRFREPFGHGQRGQQAHRNYRRHRVHHNHRPEDVQAHARSGEQTGQRLNGEEKRDEQGNQCHYPVDPHRAASKATNQDKGQESQQQVDERAANDKGSPQVRESIRNAEEGDRDGPYQKIDQDSDDEGQWPNPHQLAERKPLLGC